MPHPTTILPKLHEATSSVGTPIIRRTCFLAGQTIAPYSGGYRPGSAPTQTITDRDFTGQKENMELGLLYYNARYYVPGLGRFASADTIVPNPQSFNRYSYAFNNPIKYIDPSGHDPLDQEWEDAFYAAHGRAPTDIDRQDRLFSLIHSGSGANGEWTEDDWSLYSANRGAYWSGSDIWGGESAPGLDRFLSHLERLSTNYENDEANEFVRAVGLVWGGISYEGLTTIALISAGVGNTLAQLHEGTDGWYEGIVDDTNPAHHWAGGFVGGYALGKWTSASANIGREYLQMAMGRVGTQEDIYLGNIASRHGNFLFHDTFGFRQADDPFGKLFETMRTELSEPVPWYNR